MGEDVADTPSEGACGELGLIASIRCREAPPCRRAAPWTAANQPDGTVTLDPISDSIPPRPSSPWPWGRGTLRGLRWQRPRSPRSGGMSWQRGLSGRQIVAPRSIIACAKSPGRSAGVIAATMPRDLLLRRIARCAWSGPPLGRRWCRPTAALCRTRSQRSPPRYSRRSPATCEARLSVVGKPPLSATCSRAGDQIARPGIITEARPLARESSSSARRGERFDGRPALHESLEPRDHGRDRGLLKHDLAQPHAIGIRGRRCPAARATAARESYPHNVRSGDLRHWRARFAYGMVASDVEAPFARNPGRRSAQWPRAPRRRPGRRRRRNGVQAVRLRPKRGGQPLERNRRRALRQGLLPNRSAFPRAASRGAC